MNGAYTTRKFYQFHTQVPVHPFAHAQRDMAYLRRLTARVWKKYGGDRPMPTLKARNAITSFYQGGASYNYIVLARRHRCAYILLHELAHALTPHAKLVHGPAFTRMYIKLMAEFGGEDAGYLEIHAIDRGLL